MLARFPSSKNFGLDEETLSDFARSQLGPNKSGEPDSAVDATRSLPRLIANALAHLVHQQLEDVVCGSSQRLLLAFVPSNQAGTHRGKRDPSE